jgi:hypothetical protein
MAVTTDTITAKGIAGMYLALRKAPGQAAAPHLHLSPHAIGVLVVVGFVAAVVLYVAYRISLLLHPFTTCRRCAGTGSVGGALFPWARGVCLPCGGKGLAPRIGTRVSGGRRSW